MNKMENQDSSTEICKQVWKAIHIFGKTFNPRGERTISSFICFIECLKDLLPEIFKQECINQCPQLKSFSQEDVFKWTCTLHKIINFYRKKNNIRPFELPEEILDSSLEKKYSFITKNDWSNPVWYLMHYTSANLPEGRLSNEQRVSFKAMIVCLRYLIPCEECRGHMEDYMRNNDINPFLLTGKTAFEWTWRFHNKVSERSKKKQQYDLEASYRSYKNNRSQSSLFEFIDV